jgi:hypothetical protein
MMELGKFSSNHESKRKSSKKLKSEKRPKGKIRTDLRIKHKKNIKCSICGRVLGTGKVKIKIVCIHCYKRKGGQIIGVSSRYLKGHLEKLPQQEELNNFIDI